MARVFITGSADGLGQLAAKALVTLGHQVVLHARNAERGRQALQKVPGAENVLVADLSSLEETETLAETANASGRFDVIIHNAGLYQAPKNELSVDNLPLLFAVNSLAPYVLTCLMERPERVIYMSSGMHFQGDPLLDNLPLELKDSKAQVTYSDTKLHDLVLALAVASSWTDVFSNAVNPGWVPTKMGGASAPDSLEKGYETQVWLATSNDPEALVSGKYFHHKKQASYLQAANDKLVQQKFISRCERITGLKLEN